VGAVTLVCKGRWPRRGSTTAGKQKGVTFPMVITITKVEQIEATAVHYIDGGVA
jgi:hypothetical protein